MKKNEKYNFVEHRTHSILTYNTCVCTKYTHNVVFRLRSKLNNN